MVDNFTLQHYCEIVNKHGLHTRSAATIVELANQFECSITLSTDKGESDARDMLRLMLLEASMGSRICISVSGKDSEIALRAMIDLIAAGFYEQDD